MKNESASFGIVTTWRGGMASESTSHTHLRRGRRYSSTRHIIHADEPRLLGGRNTAPTPQALLLTAFNACMMATFAGEAAREHIRLAHLEIETDCRLDLLARASNINGNPDTLHYLIRVNGEANAEQFEKLHRLAIARSPTRWLLAQNMIIEGDLCSETLQEKQESC